MNDRNHELHQATDTLEQACANLAFALGVSWEPERRAWDLERRRQRLMLRAAGLMCVCAEHIAGKDPVKQGDNRGG